MILLTVVGGDSVVVAEMNMRTKNLDKRKRYFSIVTGKDNRDKAEQNLLVVAA